MKFKFAKPTSCLNIYNFLISIALWWLILWGFGACQELEFIEPQTDSLEAWNEFFSKDGTFLIMADTCFFRGDSIYWWVDFYISTGDPDNVTKWSEEWSKHIEDDGLPKSKGDNPLRL